MCDSATPCAVLHSRYSRPLRRFCSRVFTGGAFRRNCSRPTGSYTVAPRTRRRVARLRRARGRIVKTGPQGKIYDLAEMFLRLNRQYFGGRLPEPRLGWSTRTWRAQFGCFDPALNQIVMNRWLDRRRGAVLRRGVRIVPRDAARQASFARRTVRHGSAFARVPPRRETIRPLRTSAEIPRPLAPCFAQVRPSLLFLVGTVRLTNG